MQEKIFRKKSLEQLQAPEDLNDYIHVANPSVWIAVAAVLCLLVGVFLWGIYGSAETAFPVTGIAEDGTVILFATEPVSGVTDGIPVRLKDKEYSLHWDGIADHTEQFSGTYVGWVEAPLPDGIYSAEIITEQIPPISFLLQRGTP